MHTCPAQLKSDLSDTDCALKYLTCRNESIVLHTANAVLLDSNIGRHLPTVNGDRRLYVTISRRIVVEVE